MTNKEAEKWAIEETKRITRSILKGQHVKTWLFGSRATGKNRSFSDMDIALDAGKKLAVRVGISERKIKENIRKLKEKGLLRRLGPARGGYGEVFKQ